MEILTLENLNFTYPLAQSATLRELSLSIGEGELCLLCGETGSGKSTLLRLLKKELAPRGELSGRVLYRGGEIAAMPWRERATKIGFVMQNPDGQIVCDTVAAELAFGLENLGFSKNAIAARVAEMASYFGIEDWFDQPISALSGGQKQLLNLAAVMVMNPEILILDEPTAQLDPIAASSFLNTLKKLNEELSLTILIAEHRLEELIPICDRLLVMKNGCLVADGAPREVISNLEKDADLLWNMPSAVRLYHALEAGEECPVTAREGRSFLRAHCGTPRVRCLPLERHTVEKSPALELRDVWFRYEKNAPDVLRGLDLTVYQGEIFCLLGGNGSGKSTALAVAAGLLRSYAGTVRVLGRRTKDYKNQSLYRECLALLPQDVQTVFLKHTVREELAEVQAEPESLPFDLSPLMERHPYDLSGGEQQLVALAKVLATKPRVLLMDEPTKGIDAKRKNQMIGIIRMLQADGVTVLIVTHDVEFAAACADRTAIFFGGNVVSVDTPDVLFSQNRFYTTAASRMSRDLFQNAVTVDAVVALCRANSGEVCQ